MEKRVKVEKEKEERKKQREDLTINTKIKKKKLNYKKLKRERLLKEKKITNELINKLINSIENPIINQNIKDNYEQSASKSGKTDSLSKNDEICVNLNFDDKITGNSENINELVSLLKISNYEKNQELIKNLALNLTPKKELENSSPLKKKRGEKRGAQKNDILENLNNENGITSLVNCIKNDPLTALNILKQTPAEKYNFP